MTLAEKLKRVYTSGDELTVLKLLKELIDTVKEYEVPFYAYHLWEYKSSPINCLFFSPYTDKDELVASDEIQTIVYVKATNATMNRAIKCKVSANGGISVAYGKEDAFVSVYVGGTLKMIY